MSRVALLTYSTKARGGVVHTLALAEALADLGVDVHVFALGTEGFFRPLKVPFTLFPVTVASDSLEEKVFASVDAMLAGLAEVAGEFDVLHAQDCISGRAAPQVHARVVRTVHHVDDFTTPALVDCQRRAIVEAGHVLVVSEHWRRVLLQEYGVAARVVRNGVDPARFPPVGARRRASLRESVGAENRFLLLAVGGIEPRKGSKTLFRALGLLRGERPVLAILGGQSFRDYEWYRREALALLPGLGLDVAQLGTVSEDLLAAWYRSADALVYPSIQEGFGLVPLEAHASDLPVVASDLPVFREFLTHGKDALLTAAGDPVALAAALERIMADEELRATLVAGGRMVVPRFTWAACAAQHAEIYRSIS
ncbi:MSMEG_0565 family glycosyltransferase [Nocardia aurea]|uniref:MSMEG_0565 family glycosyltransferase n=1 Tax=Nocardia aurea TaxID=2144174 RepID=UPI0013006EC4|nr:MSMEG_0565 family glycosyltransferase [Nocardia aurea]